MKAFGLSLVAGLVLLVGAQAGDDAALKKELTALQGKWTFVKLESGGKEPEDFKGSTMEFLNDGKTVQFAKGDLVKKGTFEVNPATKPKTITIFPNDEGNVMFGIYKIEKDVMTICATERVSDRRPTEFALKEGKKFVIVTAERTK
jgi:uncharacterized protein (TIGR03067 family)